MEKKSPRVEIFSQGEEVVSGQTVDSNAAWLATQLTEVGLPVMRHTTVGDHLSDLISLLKEIASRADCCICTGGLGPTEDDLTAKAVAEAFDRPLQFDQQAMEGIQRHYQRRGREMPAINKKQAYFPQGAQRLDNDWGTAPGFSIEVAGCRFFFLPGVPFEMRQMFLHHILPALPDYFDCAPVTRVTLRIIGQGESQLQEVVNQVPLPDDVTLSFRAGSLEVQLKLLFPQHYSTQQMQQITLAHRDAIGDCVYGIDGLPDRSEGGLLAVLTTAMQEKTLVIGETVTAGEIIRRCESANWVKESRVTSESEDLCHSLDIEWNTAQPEKTAEMMAQKLIAQTQADLALVQIYMGDSAMFADEKKPAEIIVALVGLDKTHTTRMRVNGRATRKRVMSATYALDYLRRCLTGKAMDVVY